MIRPILPDSIPDTFKDLGTGGVVPSSDLLMPSLLTLGDTLLDARLNGGLTRAALHEVFAAEAGDSSAATAFALMLALRGSHAPAPILWVREERAEKTCGRLCAPGLIDLGANPADFIMIQAADARATLRTGADITRCGAVGAVVIELYGKVPMLDLTASRRLSLAAAKSGVLTLLLRVSAEPQPSAAQTRWQVSAAPSSPCAANAPGNTALMIELLRHRAGLPGFATRIEWNRDEKRCIETPLSGAVSPVALLRAG
jgi:protein ImuA